ncbi:MAG: hypothetical protein C5B50_05305 [Verrucomicrobia bacterium]|nr:MAG: hypothetical protein C5B50_05305 [Verrucomicrobiota bacterium]
MTFVSPHSSKPAMNSHIHTFPVERELLVLDVETTGLRPDRNACIEIGALLLDRNLQINSSFSSLVCPWQGAEIVPEAMQKNRITPQELAAAPPIQEVVKEFHAFAAVNPAPLIAGWNVWFDVGFLKDLYSRAALKWPFGHRLADVQSVFSYFSGFAGTSQEEAIKQMLNESQSHRALADATQTTKILQKMAGVHP